jgi:hypothetical protein
MVRYIRRSEVIQNVAPIAATTSNEGSVYSTRNDQNQHIQIYKKF